MNTVIVRREDKMPFKVLWLTIHKICFNAKKDRERAAEREESIRRDIESNKKFDRFFGPK